MTELNGDQVVKLLDPKISIKNKDKINCTTSPQQDFQQAKKALAMSGMAQDSAEQDNFIIWLV